jgi:hypothetical protein
MEKEEKEIVDVSNVAISTHNIIPNKRQTTKRDVTKFLNRRKRVLAAVEEKEKEAKK